MNEDTQVEKFEAWGLLELFGHQRIAGRLTEQAIGGVHFIRIDVPAIGDTAEYTRFFTQGAIYGMTVMTEVTARKLAGYLQAKPIAAYELQVRTPALAHDENSDDPNDDGRPF